MSVIGENLEHFKARDEIERREIEQADYLASLEDDNVVVLGPSEWFRNFSWVPVWGLAGARFRRQLELEAYQKEHGAGAGLPSYMRGQAAVAEIDLLGLYASAAARSGVNGIFCLSCAEPQKEKAKGKSAPKFYVQHFRPKDIATLVTEAKNRSEYANVYFDQNLRRVGIPNETRGKLEDIAACLALVVEEDADQKKFLEMPSGIRPTAIVRTSAIPAENTHLHFVFDRALSTQEAMDLQELAYRKMGGDVGNRDCTKAWRLPGTKNHPDWRKIARGRPSIPQAVDTIGGTGETIDPDDLRRALEAMPDRHPRKLSPTGSRRLADRGKGNGHTGYNGAGSDRDQLLAKCGPELMDEIHTEGKDRSAHFASVTWRLFHAKFTPEEVVTIVSGTPCAIKYDSADRIEAEVERLFVKWEAKNKGGWDVDENGKRYRNRENFKHGLELEGIVLRYDEFAHENQILNFGDHGPRLEDAAREALWVRFWEEHSIKYPKDDFRIIVNTLALQNKVNPAKEYFDRCEQEWDGVERLDEWLSTYMGAAATKANAFIGASMLIAAVRRVRHPGCKFDNMVVFEGPEYGGKSSAIAALLPVEEWFTDNFSLHWNAKEVIELTAGKVFVEIGELAGIKKSEVEHTKTTISRQFDEARLAYGRASTRRPRGFVFVGTTNEDVYLLSQTGNRRFWPVVTGKINLDDIRRDRDLLWGEAAYRERRRETVHVLPGKVADELFKAQRAREIGDPWDGQISKWLIAEEKLHKLDIEKRARVFRVTLVDVWKHALEMREAGRISSADYQRMAKCMRRLGWVKGDHTEWGNWWEKGEDCPF